MRFCGFFFLIAVLILKASIDYVATIHLTQMDATLYQQDSSFVFFSSIVSFSLLTEGFILKCCLNYS